MRVLDQNVAGAPRRDGPAQRQLAPPRAWAARALAPSLHCVGAMQGAARVAIALTAACVATPAIHPRTDYPTLEPDGRIGAAPIDPYGSSPEPVLRELVGEIVPSDVDLDDPGAVTAMTIRVRTGGYRLPSGPGHRVQAEAGETEAGETEAGEIQRVAIRREPGAPVSPRERADGLRATAMLDIGDPQIRATARAATAGARTDRERVLALVDWVHGHITYVLTTQTLASKVLATGSGDCSEMSLLFVALARAARVPAREVMGLAATEADGHSAFGFHAWAEVELEGRWVQVDPTWDEPQADATHILLVEGGDVPRLDTLVPLAIAVLDAQRDPRLAGHADVRRLARELPAYLQLHPAARR